MHVATEVFVPGDANLTLGDERVDVCKVRVVAQFCEDISDGFLSTRENGENRLA